MTVPSVPITIGITLTFLFHSFFQFSSKVKVFISLLLSFSFTLWSAGMAKFTVWQVLFLLLTISRSCCLTEIRWSVYILKPQRILCVSFSRMDSGLCIYNLFVWLNLNFLHNSLWITLPTLWCQVLYSFCTNLWYSLIMWLITSSLLPHHLYLLFCYILSILALIWLVLMTLFCAAIRRDSVSLLRFPFYSHDQVFSCEMSLVCYLKCPCSYFSSHFRSLFIFVLLMIGSFVLFLVAYYYYYYFTILPPAMGKS